jgi:hypothetical protein
MAPDFKWYEEARKTTECHCKNIFCFICGPKLTEEEVAKIIPPGTKLIRDENT